MVVSFREAWSRPTHGLSSSARDWWREQERAGFSPPLRGVFYCVEGHIGCFVIDGDLRSSGPTTSWLGPSLLAGLKRMAYPGRFRERNAEAGQIGWSGRTVRAAGSGRIKESIFNTKALEN